MLKEKVVPACATEFYRDISAKQLSELQSPIESFAAWSDAVEMAWYLRQSGAGEVDFLLDIVDGFSPKDKSFPESAAVSLKSRVILAKAEFDRLCNPSPDIYLRLEEAFSGFSSVCDDVGQGDVCQVTAESYMLDGRIQEAQQKLEEAVAFYRRSGHAERIAVGTARLAYQHQYENAANAQKKWGDLDANEFQAYPAAQIYAKAFNGGVKFQFGNFPEAIRTWCEAFDLATSIGAKWIAVQLSISIGSAYANLFDLATAMEWKEKAYHIAKQTGWPMALGMALASMAETTTSLKDYDRAQVYFQDAETYLERFQGTRRHVIFYKAYGILFLFMNKPESAIIFFEKAENLAHALKQADIRLSSMISKAVAQRRLGLLELAEETAARACHEARENNRSYLEIRAIQALAEAQRADDAASRQRSIATLNRAVALGDSLEQFVVESDLYSELARDYEAIGDYRQALHYERRARDSWQRNFDQQNGARILAMQVRFDTVRAKAEAEHHRQLAEAEASRAAALDVANKVLERLGVIGQEITARLDSEGVFQTLYRHIRELMPADCMFVGLADEDKRIVDIRFRMEDGQRLPPRQVAIDEDSLSARCVRENREFLVDWDDAQPQRQVPGTRQMQTALLRPLTVGDRVLGVVSVQSDLVKAYGPRELTIFHTLCAYGAIALSNAEAYGQLDSAVADLREALHRLVQQEKMAALGQLVAGVAHEVNTPLGVTLSAVSLLHDNIRSMQDTLGGGGLTRSSLSEHLQTGVELSTLAQRNVVRAAEMIRSFKEVAVDRGSDDRRSFDLGDYLREIANLMKAKLTGDGSIVELDVGLVQMETYPGALAQAVTNLLANVADHAYGPDHAGPVRLSARLTEFDMVEIRVGDQGRGIAADTLPQVFDPFFTTNRSAGHMGLGLHVAFNQVTQRLRGTLSVESVEGRGTVATIRIPRELPVSGRISFPVAAIGPDGLLSEGLEASSPGLSL